MNSVFEISGLENAEQFVTGQKSLGNEVYWNNYDLVFFRPSPRAEFSKFGAYRNGLWGYQTVSAVTDNGTWEVDSRNVVTRR